MIILAGSMRIAQGKKEIVTAAFTKLAQAVRANEPGMLEYCFGFDLADDHLLRIFEIYQDEAAVAAHRDTPYMAEARPVMQECVTERDLKRYDASLRTA